MKKEFNALKLNQNDTVAVALKTIRKGEFLSLQEEQLSFKVLMDIPYGHKIAVTPISKGRKVIKYGEIMGVATEDIQLGAHVHVSNVRGLKHKERFSNNNGEDSAEKLF